MACTATNNRWARPNKVYDSLAVPIDHVESIEIKMIFRYLPLNNKYSIIYESIHYGWTKTLNKIVW